MRDKEIYGDLLADLNDTLVADESIGLKKSSAAFVDNLDQITETMSEKILERLKIDSRVNIPGDLQEFFRALDFSTKFNDFRVPLSKRGDGIQSRHIPFILDYISEKSNKYHIWGYEEPENSLELSKAYEMAEDFSERFAVENQIFLTTHSPAFYDLRGERSERWLISIQKVDGRIEPKIDQITDSDAPDRSLGLVAAIAPRVREYREAQEKLQVSLDEMSGRVIEAEAPVVFVEGPTDVRILNHCRKVLGFGLTQYRIESANGASEITGFLKLSTRVKPDSRPLCGIYDADATGRAEFDRCKSVHKVEGTEVRVIDGLKRIYAAILPVPPHLSEAKTSLEGKGTGLPLAIEFMFERSVIDSAINEGVLILNSRMAKLALNELPFEIALDDIPGIPDQHRYLLKEVSKDTKVSFSEWVIQQQDSVFEPFRPLLNDLQKALEETPVE